MRSQLRRWEARAAAISDPLLREIARGKLVSERFNVEAGAMIATVAPARHRERAVEAIVALQVMYDYLDALTEQPSSDQLRRGLQYSKAFTDAVASSAHSGTDSDYYAHHPGGRDDGGYLAELTLAVRSAITGLPAADVIREVIVVTSARCAEAQVRIHTAAHAGMGHVERWASREAIGTGLQWREWLSGAMGSVVAVHALIALAADEHSTPQQARELDDTYLLLCVLTTMLDHLVDYEHDTLTGGPSCVRLYETRHELIEQLGAVVHGVIERTRRTRDGAHHLMILSGVVAYYTSLPSAMGEYARPVTEHVRDQLRPLITPTLASMYVWRLAKRLRALGRTA